MCEVLLGVSRLEFQQTPAKQREVELHAVLCLGVDFAKDFAGVSAAICYIRREALRDSNLLNNCRSATVSWQGFHSA